MNKARIVNTLEVMEKGGTEKQWIRKIEKEKKMKIMRKRK